MKPSIKLALFDLDNTLIDTHGVFLAKKNELLNFWSNYFPQETVKDMATDWDNLLVDAFHLYNVNPKKLWPFVIEGLNKKHKNFSSYKDESFKILWSIYTTLPPEFPGARKLLSHIQEQSIPMGLVTHAEKDWTDFKLDKHDIRKYFQEIIICDVTKPKTSANWITAINAFNIKPEETVILGDNIKGDILSGQEIGVKHLVWVNVTAGWKVYKTGHLPEGVVEVRKLDEIDLEKLLQ